MDPRTVRTRQLIIDSFNALIRTTDFQQISVKMITEFAHINRATFYAHFLDKYELLDVVLKELIEQELANTTTTETLGERFICDIFTGIANVHDAMHSGCRKGYNSFASMIEDVAKEETKALLEKSAPHLTELQIQMASWAIYGAFAQWQHTHYETAEAAAKHTAQVLQPMLAPITTTS